MTNEPLSALLVGDATELLNVDVLRDVFHLTTKAANAFLISLGVPIIYIGPAAYFRPGALDRALFLISSIQSPWARFAAPGSGYKAKKASQAKGCKTQVTADDIRKLWTPEVEKAYQDAGKSRGKTTAAVLKKLMAVESDILGTVEGGEPSPDVDQWPDVGDATGA